jgi:hypothetical protein
MRQKFFVLLLLPIIGIANFVSAQSPTTTNQEVSTSSNEQSTTSINERVQQRREDIAERRAALNERAQERIINLSANVSNRIDAVINRLLNITDRLESRANKIAATGVDTTAAKVEIFNARVAITAAANTMSNIDQEVVNMASASDARAAWLSLRSTYRQTQQSVLSARQSLRNAVSLLKEPPALSEPEENQIEVIE